MSRLTREIDKALTQVANGNTARRIAYDPNVYDRKGDPIYAPTSVVGIDEEGRVYALSYYDTQPLARAKRFLEKQGHQVSDITKVVPMLSWKIIVEKT